MVALIVALGFGVLAIAAEALHALRVRRAARLAFGPHGRPAFWALFAPLYRVAATIALAWGLTTLIYLPPKTHKSDEIPERDRRNLLLVLDVSPSMRLQDAGPTGKQSRAQRAADLLQSFFSRVPIEIYRTSVIAVFTDAKPVVVGTSDMEVVKNILNDLPMQYAFKPGPTDLFAAVQVAADTAHLWRPHSTTLIIVSDGDSIPASGMPKLPASIAHTLVVGVGDVKAGKFIDGHQSRQDSSTLQQLAVRLKGHYHNGNEKQISTDLIRTVTATPQQSAFEKLTMREYALFAIGCGGTILACLPWLLFAVGTGWRPGVPASAIRKNDRELVGAGATGERFE